MRCQRCKSELNKEATDEMRENNQPFLCGFCDGSIDTMIANGELPHR